MSRDAQHAVAARDWVCLSKGSPTKITGFIVDAVAYRLTHLFRDVGVTEEKGYVDKALGPKIHSPELEWVYKPELDDGRHDGDHDAYWSFWTNRDELAHYHTTGSLANVARLRRQTIRFPNGDGSRVVGVQIIYRNGLIEPLGQWDPDDVGTIREFYNSTDHGPLGALRLTLNEQPLYILDITADTGPRGTVPKVCRAYFQDLYRPKSWDILPGWVSKQPRASPPIPCISM